MENLNDLVTNRINAKIAKGMTNAKNTIEVLTRDHKASRDFIFEVGTLNRGVMTKIDFKPDTTGKVGATFTLPSGMEDFTMNIHAVRQVAEKLSIPTAYLTALLFGQAWERDLAYDILNRHNGWKDRNKVLVRAVGTEVRAVLTDSYRRLNSELIISNHLEEVFSNGAVVSDGWIDSTKVMIEGMLPYPIELRTELNGSIFLAFGTRYSTSD